MPIEVTNLSYWQEMEDMSTEERAYITHFAKKSANKGAVTTEVEKSASTPYWGILTTPCLWALVLFHVTMNGVEFGLNCNSRLPIVTYLSAI